MRQNNRRWAMPISIGYINETLPASRDQKSELATARYLSSRCINDSFNALSFTSTTNPKVLPAPGPTTHRLNDGVLQLETEYVCHPLTVGLFHLSAKLADDLTPDPELLRRQGLLVVHHQEHTAQQAQVRRY